MNPVFASDLQFMTADFGQEIVWGAFRTKANVGKSTEDLVAEDGFAIVRGETPVISYATTTLPGLKGKAILTVDGVSHRVRHVDLEGDGLHALAYLELV